MEKIAFLRKFTKSLFQFLNFEIYFDSFVYILMTRQNLLKYVMFNPFSHLQIQLKIDKFNFKTIFSS